MSDPQNCRTRMRLLTSRQRDVLALVAEGRTNSEIGEALGISFETAKMHVGDILTRLGVSSREEAAAAWNDAHQPGTRMRILLGNVFITSWRLAGLSVAGVFAVAGVLVVIAVIQGMRVERVSSDPATLARQSPSPSLIGTRWDLLQLDGQAVVSSVRQPNLTLQSDNLAVGFGGCNQFGGVFTMTDNVVTFTDGPTQTQMGCGSGGVETRYMAALASGPFRLDQDGDSLQITASDGTILDFVTRREGDPSNQLTSERWVLSEINGFGTIEFLSYVFAFAADGSFVVTAPCGEFRGTYARSGLEMRIAVDGDTPASCAEPEREFDQRLRTALEDIDSYIIDIPRVSFAGDATRVVLQQKGP